MTLKTWTWIGADQTYVEQARISPEMVGGPYTGYLIEKRRLYGGLSDGVDLIHVDNGLLRFDLLPTRGMGIWKMWAGDLPVGWNSPVRGPVHPKFVPLAEPNGLGWLDGFDELLVRCGLESNGAPEFGENGQLRYGLHGRIANRPAHQLEARADGQTGELSVTGIVDETRFHFHKLRMFSTITTRVGEAAVTVRDTVQNISGSTATFQMLYHINFGPPLLGAGSSVAVPIKTLMPRDRVAVPGLSRWAHYGPPRPNTPEEAFFFDLQTDSQGQTAVLLKDPIGAHGVSVHFNTGQLPCFTLWKNETAEADGFVTGLEPATNFPNPRSFEAERGRVVTLEPGDTWTAEVQLQVHRTADAVSDMQQQIESLAKEQPTIHETPQRQWSAGA